MSTRRLAESLEGFNSSLAPAPGDLKKGGQKRASQYISSCSRQREYFQSQVVSLQRYPQVPGILSGNQNALFLRQANTAKQT